MKTLAVAVILSIGAWPSPSVACLMPTPALMDWAKCAVAKLPSQGRTDIDTWRVANAAYPQPGNVPILWKSAQKWVPNLSRACGSYALLRQLETHRLERFQGYADPMEVTESELDLIAVYLAFRKIRYGDDLKTCGG
jgi:hypothetical protein